MFSNKGFRLKLAGALVVIALMGVYAAREGESINPALWRCVAQPERWRDRTLWISTAVIVATRESDFDLQTPEVRVRVVGRPPGKAGESISLTAVFRADSPRLEMIRGRVLPPHSRYRWLLETLSVLVLLGVLANVARHFAFRPKVLQVEGAP